MVAGVLGCIAAVLVALTLIASQVMWRRFLNDAEAREKRVRGVISMLEEDGSNQVVFGGKGGEDLLAHRDEGSFCLVRGEESQTIEEERLRDLMMESSRYFKLQRREKSSPS
jgi:hypothetical protein